MELKSVLFLCITVMLDAFKSAGGIGLSIDFVAFIVTLAHKVISSDAYAGSPIS